MTKRKRTAEHSPRLSQKSSVNPVPSIPPHTTQRRSRVTHIGCLSNLKLFYVESATSCSSDREAKLGRDSIITPPRPRAPCPLPRPSWRMPGSCCGSRVSALGCPGCPGPFPSLIAVRARISQCLASAISLAAYPDTAVGRRRFGILAHYVVVCSLVYLVVSRIHSLRGPFSLIMTPPPPAVAPRARPSCLTPLTYCLGWTVASHPTHGSAG